MQAHRGAAASGEQAKQTAHPPKTDASQSGRPGGFTRRNSFGNTLYKFTDRANSFGHRRRMTTATLTSSSTLPSISLTQSHQSHLPTPSGIPRSSSFFGSLDAFVTPNVDENANPSTPNASGTRRYRKVSEKFIQLPFFSHQNQSHLPQRALSPRTKRESSIKIEHRGLMAPIQPVSLPRSSTMDNVTQQRGILASPSFMHPTSSSANRRQSMTLSKRPQLPMPHYTSSSTAVIQPHWSMHGLRRQSVNSPLCKELGTPLASSSSTNCFPIWKESVSSRYSPPPRAAAPAAKTSSMVHRAAATHDSTLARTTQVPTATQVPTPTVPLLTPEYENSDEDERDKRATCSQAHLRPGNGDESGMTATQFDDEPEMVCCPICSQNVLDEGHRQACTIFYQSKNIFEGQGSNDAERGSELTDHVIDSDSPPYVGTPQLSPFLSTVRVFNLTFPFRSMKRSPQTSGLVDIPRSLTVSAPKACPLLFTHRTFLPSSPLLPLGLKPLECSTMFIGTRISLATSTASARQRKPA